MFVRAWWLNLISYNLLFGGLCGHGFSSGVEDGAIPTTFHKGRCHNDLMGSAPLDLHLPKITSLHRMHESTSESYLFNVDKSLQIGVAGVVDPMEEFYPNILAAIVFL